MVALADIRPADLFGNPPGAWFTKEISRLQGSETFHWGMWVRPQDLVVTESIDKGTAITRYNYSASHIYRIRALQDVSTEDILNAIADYGRSTYGMSENFSTASQFLLAYYAPQYIWEGPPVPSFLPGWPWRKDTVLQKTFSKPLNAPVNCIQYVTLLSRRLGYEILPEGDLVVEINLENSPLLEYLGILEMEGSEGY